MVKLQFRVPCSDSAIIQCYSLRVALVNTVCLISAITLLFVSCKQTSKSCTDEDHFGHLDHCTRGSNNHVPHIVKQILTDLSPTN